MRSLPLALLLALSGCYVYEAPYRVPPPAEGPQPTQAYLTRDQAVDIAFRAARERGLHVDRLQHAHLDASGRWHIDLRGHGDRARLLVDARDGRLLKGKFKASDEDFED